MFYEGKYFYSMKVWILLYLFETLYIDTSCLTRKEGEEIGISSDLYSVRIYDRWRAIVGHGRFDIFIREKYTYWQYRQEDDGGKKSNTFSQMSDRISEKKSDNLHENQ